MIRTDREINQPLLPDRQLTPELTLNWGGVITQFNVFAIVVSSDRCLITLRKSIFDKHIKKGGFSCTEKKMGKGTGWGKWRVRRKGEKMELYHYYHHPQYSSL